MNNHLKEELERMGCQGMEVKNDEPYSEQDFLIMSRLLRITRTNDFSEDEITYYQWCAESAVTQQGTFARGRILTPDFSEEELAEYQWAAEHPTGSCRGYRLTDEPTEQEVNEWQETLKYLNELDFVAARSRIKFIEREPETPYADDPMEQFDNRS